MFTKRKRPIEDYEYHMLKPSEGGTSRWSIEDALSPIPVRYDFSSYVGCMVVIIPGAYNTAAARRCLQWLG